jgi:phosphate starvation-inducible PhoH-like protein
MPRQQHRVSKRQKRLQREEGIIDDKNQLNTKFNLVNIHQKFSLTKLQLDTIQAFERGDHLVLHGVAGTGKTFISAYIALKSIQEKKYQKLFFLRSAVPTRDMGFLPGNWRQKAQVYEDPYVQICNELYGRGDAYDILKQKNITEFLTTSFVRGTTFRDCILLIDEINNMSFHELDSLITRVGPNCRIIFCGDYRQSDLKTTEERSGLNRFIEILNSIRSFTHFEFGIEDIVRSDVVKEYIIGKNKLNYV